MAQTLINSSFKVKVGTVKNTVGVLPEKGAIVWDDDINSLVAGDGFNWNPFGGVVEPLDAVATDSAGVANTMAAGVEKLIDWMSSIIYVRGTKITVDITPGAQNITFVAAGFYQLNSNYSVQCNVNNVTLILITKLNGIEITRREVFMQTKDKPYPITSSGLADIPGAGDVLTVHAECDWACNLLVTDGSYGVTFVSV